jgi:hypothetical protein
VVLLIRTLLVVEEELVVDGLVLVVLGTVVMELLDLH